MVKWVRLIGFGAVKLVLGETHIATSNKYSILWNSQEAVYQINAFLLVTLIFANKLTIRYHRKGTDVTAVADLTREAGFTFSVFRFYVFLESGAMADFRRWNLKIGSRREVRGRILRPCMPRFCSKSDEIRRHPYARHIDFFSKTND